MRHALSRAAAVALFGMLAGPVCLALLYAARPDVTITMDKLGPIASGFYPAEHAGDHWFAWTQRTASIRFAGLDRRSAWTCTVRFRGARPTSAGPQPQFSVSTGDTVAVRAATNEFQDVQVSAPVRAGTRDLTLTLTSSNTFEPGPGDPRSLGVQVDAVSCRPEGALMVLPPRRAMAGACAAAAVFGGAFGLAGITAGSAVLATAVVAIGQAVPLSQATAPFLGYAWDVALLAACIAFFMLVVMRAVEVLNGQPLRNTARFAIVFSAGALFLKLAMLLHPSKAVVDALFHAHRFDAVLAGHWYFTQLSTSATPFPYAIGLYLFAAPFAFLTSNHVALLRVVVSSVDVVAGALLYVLIVRTTRDRLAAAIAVALVNLVPITYGVVGNANLTNAFGGAVALATVVAAAALPLEPRRIRPMAGMIVLATLAFLSHVSIVVVLGLTLVGAAFYFWWSGEPALRTRARALVVATLIAAAAAVIIYWGHFGNVYAAQLARMRAPAPVSAAAPANRGDAAATVEGKPRLGRSRISLAGRAAGAAAQTRDNIGLPILLLAVLGAWRLGVRGGMDVLAWTLAAWGTACLLLVGFSVIAPGEVRYQQDAWEFISRVEHATSPAAVILAAIGAAWAWAAGNAWRVAAMVLLVASVVVGVGNWLAWLH